MTSPIAAVVAIHDAFRRDMEDIDAAAFGSARGKPGLEAAVERFRFMNEVLAWHADGEEQAIFPVGEEVAPLVAEAYEKDHRGLDAAFDSLSTAVSARDPLETAGGVPRDRFPEFVAWMYPLLGHDDRENMTRIWQMVMPPEAFGGAAQLAHQAIGDDFAELAQRIPDLAA